MSTYAYCYNCAGPLDGPSLADAVIGAITCPHCDEERAYILDGFTRRMVLHEVTEELMNLRQEVDKAEPTMALRDQFAMAALSALAHHRGYHNVPEEASSAYRMADAMLKAREKADD